jgi:acyl-CoA-binding protein
MNITSLFIQVRLKLRKGWRNDDAVLNQYFQSCVSNWKFYKGPRKAKQVIKLQAVYKQAIYGDNTDLPPVKIDSPAGLKWQEW